MIVDSGTNKIVEPHIIANIELYIRKLSMYPPMNGISTDIKDLIIENMP